MIIEPIIDIRKLSRLSSSIGREPSRDKGNVVPGLCTNAEIVVIKKAERICAQPINQVKT